MDDDNQVTLPPLSLPLSDWEYIRGALIERQVGFEEFVSDALIEAAHK